MFYVYMSMFTSLCLLQVLVYVYFKSTIYVQVCSSSYTSSDTQVLQDILHDILKWYILQDIVDLYLSQDILQVILKVRYLHILMILWYTYTYFDILTYFYLYLVTYTYIQDVTYIL